MISSFRDDVEFLAHAMTLIEGRKISMTDTFGSWVILTPTNDIQKIIEMTLNRNRVKWYVRTIEGHDVEYYLYTEFGRINRASDRLHTLLYRYRAFVAAK